MDFRLKKKTIDAITYGLLVGVSIFIGIGAIVSWLFLMTYAIINVNIYLILVMFIPITALGMAYLIAKSNPR